MLFYVWAVTYLWIYPLKYFITFREFTSTFSFTTFHNVRCLFKCIILLSLIGNNERTRFDAYVKIMLDRKVRVYIKFVWCSCVNISAFTSLHILPVKTPLRRVHPNSRNTRCRCVRHSLPQESKITSFTPDIYWKHVLHYAGGLHSDMVSNTVSQLKDVMQICAPS